VQNRGRFPRGEECGHWPGRPCEGKKVVFSDRARQKKMKVSAKKEKMAYEVGNDQKRGNFGITRREGVRETEKWGKEDKTTTNTSKDRSKLGLLHSTETVRQESSRAAEWECRLNTRRN